MMTSLCRILRNFEKKTQAQKVVVDDVDDRDPVLHANEAFSCGGLKSLQ